MSITKLILSLFGTFSLRTETSETWSHHAEFSGVDVHSPVKLRLQFLWGQWSVCWDNPLHAFLLWGPLETIFLWLFSLLVGSKRVAEIQIFFSAYVDHMPLSTCFNGACRMLLFMLICSEGLRRWFSSFSHMLVAGIPIFLWQFRGAHLDQVPLSVCFNGDAGRSSSFLPVQFACWNAFLPVCLFLGGSSGLPRTHCPVPEALFCFSWFQRVMGQAQDRLPVC